MSDTGVIDYRDESLKLLELMRKAGVLEPDVVEKVLSEVEDETEIVEAEVIEESVEQND